ncbi:hypothetical protein H2199_004077 [Coniosporium tulheliwenetii]|uniref:Uncharacterized protein n=1 Tax=Coniosporium tulheliwenetii TaxID=3383036 RepID=A0ACC2Z795_9PEZI|nr:hypothetical protein H2199_004077 [Cladosporium sp. JES 115]
MAPQKSLKRKADELDEAPASERTQEDPIGEHDASDYSDTSSSEENEEASRPTLTPGSPLTTCSTPRTPREKNFHCHYPNCGKSFIRPSRLEEHILSHTGGRPFACKQCPKTFVRNNHLKRHVKTSHTSERDYICHWPSCGKGFASGTRLRRHIATHEAKEQYRCTAYPPCNAIFRKHTTLQKHIASAHLNQKAWPCTFIDDTTGQPCTHAYDTESALRAHQGRIHGGSRYVNTRLDFRRDHSNSPDSTPRVTFPTYALLQSHIKTAHPPQCPHCPRTFDTPRALRQHIEIAHATPLEARQTFRCDVPGCGRGFTKAGNLAVHKKTVHGAVKAFVCGTTDMGTSKDEEVRGWWGGEKEGACGFALGTKANLEEHVRTQHLGKEGMRARKARKKAEESGVDLEEIRRRNLRRKKGSEMQQIVAPLTGAGWEELGRNIDCLKPECAHKFMREYDLWNHCRALHVMSDAEIREAIALAGGQFWMHGAGNRHQGYLDEEDLTANEALDREAGIVAGLERFDVYGGVRFARSWDDGGVPVDPALFGGEQQGVAGLEAVKAYLQQEG